jgi:hypothetical protein
MAESEIAILERNALSHRLASEAELSRHVEAVESERNQQRRGILWQFTRARCTSQAGAALSSQGQRFAELSWMRRSWRGILRRISLPFLVKSGKVQRFLRDQGLDMGCAAHSFHRKGARRA